MDKIKSNYSYITVAVLFVFFVFMYLKNDDFFEIKSKKTEIKELKKSIDSLKKKEIEEIKNISEQSTESAKKSKSIIKKINNGKPQIKDTSFAYMLKFISDFKPE